MVFFYVFIFFMALFFGGWVIWFYQEKKWEEKIKKEMATKTKDQIIEHFFDLKDDLCENPLSRRKMIEYSIYSRECNHPDFWSHLKK